MTSANRSKILLVDHKAHARGGSAVAGVLFIALQPETVIVGQLFAGVDAAPGIEPDATAHNIRLAVGRAAVIEKAGRIPHYAAVDIVVLVEGKEIDIALLVFILPFGFRYLRADVLDDALAFSQVNPGKAA
jgi:hypothetical protein